MIEPSNLKTLIVYDDQQNEYTIYNHNLEQQQTGDLMSEWQPHLQTGCTFITVDQNQQHKTDNAQDCRTCRNDVRRVLSLRLNKVPKFKRRNA